MACRIIPKCILPWNANDNAIYYGPTGIGFLVWIGTGPGLSGTGTEIYINKNGYD